MPGANAGQILHPKTKVRPDFQVCGVDPGGLGGDPMVFEVGARVNGKYWINIYESYHERISNSGIIEVMRYIQTTFKVKMFWFGPDEPRLVEMVQGEGFMNALINQVTTKPGSAEFRIRTLYSLIAQKRFLNDPSKCPKLEEEIGTLRYPRNRQGVPTKKPRGKDHAIDAATYYLVGEGETPEKIKIDPEDQRTSWVDSTGFHDNPVAVNAKKNKLAGDPEAWWDEIEDQQDGAAYINELNSYLGIKTKILE